MSIIINLFGDGIRYWICDIPIDRFEAMKLLKEKQNSEWEHLFYDLSSLKKFGYAHWSELATRGEFKSFQLNDKNRIELKRKSKLLERIITQDLDNSRTFIPLYETEVIENLIIPKIENHVTFILVQQETGLFGKYQIDQDKLLFSDLRFSIIQQIEGNDLNGLTGISFKDCFIRQVGEDTVIRGSKVWFL